MGLLDFSLGQFKRIGAKLGMNAGEKHSPGDMDGRKTEMLKATDFELLPSPPFNPAIRISQSMAWFKGCLYVGGGRGPLKSQSQRAGSDSADYVEDGAEICRYSPETGSWEKVYSSPLNDSADPVARDRSVRAHAIVEHTGGDSRLYFALGSLEDQVVIVSSDNGDLFEECGQPGLGQGDGDIASIRNLCLFNNRMYTSPVGKNKGRGMADDNVADVAAVFESEVTPSEPWKIVSEPSFGDDNNESINELVEFNGCLYAATLNRRSGFQLWKGKSDKTGRLSWEKQIDNGAWRYAANPVPACMHVFNNALYIGTGVQRQGRRGMDRFGPIAPELIRVNADDSWDLIAGDPRCTPEGLKMPLSGLGAGFGNLFNQAFWSMTVHNDLLYLGTSDWRFWPSYLPRGRQTRDDLSEDRLAYLSEETRAYTGEYGLYCSADGDNWQCVTDYGLGENSKQYGIRGLLSTPAGLVVVPASRQGNESGNGVEIWCAWS